MFDVPSVGEDLAVDGFQLVGTWTEYFYDDVRPLPGWVELVVVLVALHEAENQVPDIEGSVPHPSAVVPMQRHHELRLAGPWRLHGMPWLPIRHML